MANDNDRLVVAYYINESAARAAAEGLKDWDDAHKDIKLGAMAVMTIDSMGKLHADEIGQRNTKSGALWGTAIGIGVGILTAGIGLIPGLLMGAGGGAAIGAMSHKDVGMTDEQHAALVDHLKHGGAALAVMADDFEVAATLAKMVDEGGKTESYKVPATTQQVMASVAAAQATASAQVESALVASADEVAEATRAVAVELPDLDEASAMTVGTLAAATGMTGAQAAKVHQTGLAKASEFLECAATPDGRAEIAATTAMTEDEVLAAVKKLDLMRIEGVGPKYAALLLAAGVDTVPELARRNAANLTAALQETNTAQGIVQSVPSVEQVEGWIAQAKEMPRVIVF